MTESQTENCYAYRDAITGYIDLLKDLGDCTALYGNIDYSGTILDLESGLKNVDCN